MKLLNRSLLLYLLYAIIILIIAVPLFYYAVQGAVRDDADESLAVRKNEFLFKATYKDINNAAPSFGLRTSGIQLQRLPSYQSPEQHDSLYTIQQYDSISKEMQPYRVYESIIVIGDYRYKLILKDSLVDADELIESIVKIAAILLVCIIAGLYLINIFISKRTWKPFYQTLETLNDFSVDKSEPLVLQPSKISEFNDLNSAIVKLADNNRKVYQSQKEFTENASHEMQTPIAILQTKIELLMQTEPLSSVQAELLSEIEATNQRMSKLNNTLLLFTKIDNNQFPEIESLELAKIIEQLLAIYQNAIIDKEISVKKELFDDSMITANRSVIEMLIGNLLTNAIRHNIHNGEIEITIAKKILKISNSGSTAALDISRLFQRFQKQDSTKGNLGLGLALVYRICNLYNATINYAFHDNRHVFTVDFTAC